MPIIAAHELSPEQGNQMIYNGLDSCMTVEVHEALRQLPGANDTLIYDFERAMQAPALEMMLRGFRVDPEARDKAILVAHSKLENTKRILDAMARGVWDKGVNANSGAQLKDLFYNHMNIKPISMSVKGESKIPMDRKVLERLGDYFYARPIVNAVLLHRDLGKTLQVLETGIDPDLRWRCSYNIGGTSTGRWSSSKSSLGTGNNFQNITDELRRIFIPDPGWKLCGIDLEQAEAREVGWFCGTVLGDWSYLDACESGDLHTFVTRLVYPDWDWTGDLKKDRKLAERRFYRQFTYRDANKRVGHGSNYLGKPPTISSQTKIPIKLVAEFQDRYFSAFPCIPRMHHWIARHIQTEGYLVNAFGRRRDFFDRAKSDETLRSAVAYMFQSATGDRLNLGLWKVWKHMGKRVQILAQLHDAIYFQYRLCDNEKEVISLAQRYMDIPLRDPKSGRVFTIPSEAKAGFNWASRYRLDSDGNLLDWNPRGLDKVRLN